MSKSFNLTYIGDIRSLAASGKKILFTTEHPESKSTALYLIDAESNRQSEISLPCGGLSVCVQADQYWIGGTDGVLYTAGAKDKSAKPSKAKIPEPATQLVPIGETQIACVTGDTVSIVDSKGKLLSSLDFEVEGESVQPTSVGASPDGIWMAIGTSDGSVFVYEQEEKAEFQLSESSQIHKGEVTAILFDREELRFFSAGLDHKLLVTHARGTLEPEDRGRAYNHDKRVTSILHAGENRLITGSADKSCKSWLCNGATRPSTLSDGIVAVSHLALATVHKRSMLVAAQSDNSIRMFLVEDGKFGSSQARYNDGYFRAERLFESSSPSDRGDGIHELAANDDRKSLEMLAGRVANDSDNKLRLTAAKLVCKSKHDCHFDLLEKMLAHGDEPVRQTVFDYLVKAKTESRDRLKLCESAIETGQPDIGCDAVKVTEKLTNDKSESDAFRNRARDLLVQTLNSETSQIRRAAVLSLESVFEKGSPVPNLIALKSQNADSRKVGLIRLLQRKLLADEESAGGIRQMIVDPDAEVRKTARLLLYLSRKKLAQAIRLRDKDLDRQFGDLESFSLESKASKKTSKATEPKEEVAKKAKKTGDAKTKNLPKLDLKDDDYQPLLIAVSAQAMDTSLSGAKCLALLEDPRAFGVLMQLSSESNAGARVDVCKALGALGDPRANDRLSSLLRDEEIEVRDAAYSALEKTRHEDPLRNAADGLGVEAEDIRRRGLQTLVKLIRKRLPKETDSPECVLLKRALNDSSQAVRNEAFKIVLNSKIGGGVEQALRFALNSVHAEVRSEVLTETMAQQKEKWAPALLLEILNDPETEIRTDAFKHLKKECKENDIGWLETAVESKYPDIRKQAVQRLVKNKTDESDQLLSKAIDDEDEGVRELVLNSLEASDDVEPLRQALGSERLDVRLAAASSLAARGDEICREVLIAAVQTPKPENDSEIENWRDNVEASLTSLAQLSDPTTFEVITPFLDHEYESLRKAAAYSLAWTVRPETIDKVSKYLKHEDECVKSRAAFAMAVGGDPESLPLVFSPDAKSLQGSHRLIAAAILDRAGESYLATVVDGRSEAHRNVALIVLLVRDWMDHDGSPRRLTACLAARCFRTRLLAAHAVEDFLDSEKVFAVIQGLFNDRGDQKPWTISDSVIRRVAATIVFGSERLVGRLVYCLVNLGEEKQKAWNQSWKVFSKRYSVEIEEAEAAAKESKLPKFTSDQDSLHQLVFGVYVGIVRQQSSVKNPGFGVNLTSVRESAMRSLVKLSLAEKSFLQSAESVLTQTTGDRYQEIRNTAFAQLVELGVSDETRAAIAIGSKHRDLAVAGLELLQESGSKADQKKVLSKIILGRNDEVAFEAARLLKKEMDPVKVCEMCFDSPYMRLPAIATSWLAELYDSTPAAKKLLQSLAKDSEEFEVRKVAVTTLVNNQDKKAFDCLSDAVQSDEPETRQSYLGLFGVLKDDRGIGFLVSELESHPEYDDIAYFEIIGQSRNAEVGERLIQLFETRTSSRARIFTALLRVSGYDQSIHDPDELLIDQSFRNKDFPRHNDLLAQFLESVHQFGIPKQIKTLIRSARWAKGSEVDPVLSSMAIHPDESTRRDVVEAIGFRARKRSCDTTALVEALQHRDPVTKFLAAEGLAKSGNAKGIHILLTAIELVEDLGLRRRAVMALGHLADERAFDVLLKLATEEGHALQDCAAGAIGHLRESAGKDKILQTLIRLVHSEGSVGEQALVGLRWLDLPEGWDLIRDRASSDNQLCWPAIEQLGYNDDPASQDLLLGLFGSDGYWDPLDLLKIAKRSFGPDSIVPELTWAKSQTDLGMEVHQIYSSTDSYWDTTKRALIRIRETATPEEIFDLVGESGEQIRKEFTQHLLMCDPLPVASAAKYLESDNPAIAEVSAWIIGRAGDKKQAKSLAQVLDQWLEKAEALSQKLYRIGQSLNDDFTEMVSCLKRMIWAAGATGGNEKQLAGIVTNHSEVEGFEPIRHAAIDELLRAEKLPEVISKQLKGALEDHDSYIRTGVVEILASLPKAKVNELAERVLPDRRAFNKLGLSRGDEIKKAIQASASHTHYQSRSLPFLIKSGDTKTLGAVATDGDLSLVARLGAVEGLAKIPSKESDKHLIAIGNDESNDEELRKAAWRGLRRSKRQRKAEAK